MREEGDFKGAGHRHLGDKRLAERERIGILRQRSQLLAHKDAVFIQMVLERGSSFRQISKLTGQNENALRRRFQKLSARLISKETVALFRNHQLDEATQTIARAYYIEGLSLQEIAARTGHKLYFVRKKVIQIRGLARKQDRGIKCINSM